MPITLQPWNLSIAPLGGVLDSRNPQGTQPNRPPVLAAIGAQTQMAGSTFSIANYASDPDGDALTFERNGGTAPAGVTISPQGSVAITVGAQTGGPYTVGVRVTDGRGGQATGSFDLTITPSTATGWQLEAGHYVAAKMTPVIVHPRPDVETNSWERHRLAPDEIAWSIPIAVQGGAWPFRYSVDATSAAKGITIGETYGSIGYGVLSWASPTIGTHTITVTVRTQEYGRNTSGLADELSVTFTLEVAAQNDSRFAFLNGGTLESVLGSTSVARQLFLRAGTYATDGAAQFALDGSRPSVIVGYPGEAVTINYTQRNFAMSASGASVHSVALDNSAATYSSANIKAFVVSGRRDRLTLHDCAFSGWASRGTSASNNVDNPACLDIPAVLNNSHQYLTIVGCTVTSCVLPLVDAYCVDYAVVENNDCDWSVDYVCGKGIFPKNADRYWSIRGNRVSGSYRNPTIGNNASDALIALYLNPYSSNPAQTSGNVEACFNSIRMNTVTDNGLCVGSFSTVSTFGPVWEYRNTVYGRVASAPSWVHHVENEVVVTTASPPVSANVDSNTGSECQGPTSLGIVDVSNLLAGAYASYRGTRGHEIA